MSIEIRWVLVVALVGLLTLSGCGDDKSTSTEEPVDTISIKSVTPDSGLIPDNATDFIVVVEYELVSADSGEVSIGFNTDEVGRFVMITDAKILVARSSGERQFNVNAVVEDWGAAGDFKVYVNLSEHPHETSWTPLATDIQVLAF